MLRKPKVETMKKPTKPRPKPFPRLPRETPQQRAALAQIGPREIEAARQWIDGCAYGFHPVTGKVVKDAVSSGLLKALLNAEDA